MTSGGEARRAETYRRRGEARRDMKRVWRSGGAASGADDMGGREVGGLNLSVEVHAERTLTVLYP